MIKEVIRALRLPIYAIAAVLLMAAYVYAYLDYVQTIAPSQVTVSSSDGSSR